MAHKLFEVGQKAFIERDGQVLVVFFPNGWLDFPGGRINDDDESLASALLREIREETALEVEVGRPFATWLGRDDTVLLVGYHCRYVRGEVVLSNEHSGHRWVNESSYQELDDGSPPFAALTAYFDASWRRSRE